MQNRIEKIERLKSEGLPEREDDASRPGPEDRAWH